MGNDHESAAPRRDLVVQTFVGAVVGSASLVNPEAGLAASTAAPSVAYGINRLIKVLSHRRSAHAEEALNDAATAASLSVETFIDQALADEKRTELLVRALTTAQDAALRGKRRALGRALAAGVCGSSTTDDEFLFIRALADLDEPHITVLQVLGEDAPSHQLIPPGWFYNEILERVPGFANALRSILTTLELHTLITRNQLANEMGNLTDTYRIGPAGQMMLSRLADDGAS